MYDASMRAADLLAWLAGLAPSERDAAAEEHLGIGPFATPAPASLPPGEHLIGYHASGVAPIVRMLVEVPVTTDDIVIDLGSGLGKVVLLTWLLTGATSRGIELQPALVGRARVAAARRGANVAFTEGDARRADLEDGTVFFLYAPFTGPVLAEVLSRLRAAWTLAVKRRGSAPGPSMRSGSRFTTAFGRTYLRVPCATGRPYWALRRRKLSPSIAHPPVATADPLDPMGLGARERAKT
jgi:hypothetical protein